MDYIFVNNDYSTRGFVDAHLWTGFCDSLLLRATFHLADWNWNLAYSITSGEYL